MKKIIAITLILLSITVLAQNKQEYCFTKNEILNISNNIKYLQYNDSTYKILVYEQQKQIKNYQILQKIDSATIQNLSKQLSTADTTIMLYKKMSVSNKSNWYDNPYVIVISCLVGLEFVKIILK